MGLFSKIFGGGIKKAANNASFLGVYRLAGGQSYSGGGWGHDRFCSIIDAHSSTEEMVDTFQLDGESCPYPSVDGYANPYTQAYMEARETAQEEAMFLQMFGEEVDVEELIDWDAVEENAYEYACELFDAWYDGSEWISEEIMDFAWFALSSHNY